MQRFFNLSFGLAIISALSSARMAADSSVVDLPNGVTAVWDSSKAFRETTPTRERISLNGLWRWQPAETEARQPPDSKWGYFKVPGCWPGIGDYMQKDSQTVIAFSDWKGTRLGNIDAAWYQRELTVPKNWTGRRISLAVEYLNSFAIIFVDGKNAGELRFPGGEVDLGAACQPGSTHLLSLLVVAMPLKGVMQSYTDSASARTVKGKVARRGLCGDVYLLGTPAGARLTEFRTTTSVRKKEANFEAALDGLVPGTIYRLRVRIEKDGRSIKEFSSRNFRGEDLREGWFGFVEKWLPDKLWDTHTPQNQYDVQVALLDNSGRVLDTGWTERVGFREFYIDGRDFFLNGSRIFLSAVPLDNAEVGASLATYEAARESLQRLKSFGINYVYTHNYGCEPGSHLGFTEILKAADDLGMLVGMSQPHFSHYEWQASEADQNNGYARHAAFYVRVSQNHPSVIMYAMSHNATGYSEDMNPDMIDGLHDPRDTWATRNAKLALRAEAIVRRLDPSRIVYHHASGNLGAMHDSNFYPNFVPIQELSDWFGHWAMEGVKPAFTCEYGAPFTWDWTMYRGWYKGQREFGSAQVPWEYCIAEWNAQFFGDKAYRISEAEKTNLRWEAGQFRAGNVWHRWDYPNQVGSDKFDECYPVFAMYLEDNWRAFRTWGVSAISPWEFGHFWKLRSGVDRSRKEIKVDWDHLQRPGFSPDYDDQRYERMDLAYSLSDWVATPAAEALMRNNRPLLAYLGGKPTRFTSKDHNFFVGDSVEKQVIVINNSRETVTCDVAWSVNFARGVTGTKRVTVRTGDQAKIRLAFDLAPTIAPGRYAIEMTARFSTGETQQDKLMIDVLSRPGAVAVQSRIALFDPKGETASLLARLGIQSQPVDAAGDLARYDVLLVGKGALTLDQPAPDIARVREGFRVIVFEQTSEVLEKRFGFRVEEYGLRQLFARVLDHPLLAGINADMLHDWRGEATILPAQLSYEMRPRYGPTVKWCDIPVTRVWRCGNRGNVASVLIEKPARGDFLPVLDGGYGLQYSPLLEYREGKGLVVFCQLDVTGRSENDPAAELLARNLVRYVADWKPASRRQAVYLGDDAGRKYLETAGLTLTSYHGAEPAGDQVLIAGPGSGQAGSSVSISEWLKRGGRMVAIGLEQNDVDNLLPFKVTMKKAEHIAAYFDPFELQSPLAGVGPADVHNRDPRVLPLITGGVRALGDGVLAQAENANVIFCQMAPWQFENSQQSNLRRTYRRASFLVARLLANEGVAATTPLLDRFHSPVAASESKKRWQDGFYLDQPEEWDDPYRFFRW